MSEPIQMKWRDCKECGRGFKQPSSEPPAKVCPKCVAAETAQQGDVFDGPERLNEREKMLARWNDGEVPHSGDEI